MTLHAFLEAMFRPYTGVQGAPRVLLSGDDAVFDDVLDPLVDGLVDGGLGARGGLAGGRATSSFWPVVFTKTSLVPSV